MNPEVASVMRNIANWRHAIERFEHGIAQGWISIEGDCAVHFAVDGTRTLTSLAEIEAWKRDVARIETEAAKRSTAGDTEWFYWLRLFGSMQTATERDDFTDRFTRAIDAGNKAIRGRAKGPAAAARKRAAKKEKRHANIRAGKLQGASDSTVRRALKGR